MPPLADSAEALPQRVAETEPALSPSVSEPIPPQADSAAKPELPQTETSAAAAEDSGGGETSSDEQSSSNSSSNNDNSSADSSNISNGSIKKCVSGLTAATDGHKALVGLREVVVHDAVCQALRGAPINVLRQFVGGIFFLSICPGHAKRLAPFRRPPSSSPPPPSPTAPPIPLPAIIAPRLRSPSPASRSKVSRRAHCPCAFGSVVFVWSAVGGFYRGR